MNAAKEEVRRLLDRLPEDVSLPDILYHVYVLQRVEQGLDDAAAGRIISQDELDARMPKWLAP